MSSKFRSLKKVFDVFEPREAQQKWRNSIKLSVTSDTSERTNKKNYQKDKTRLESQSIVKKYWQLSFVDLIFGL